MVKTRCYKNGADDILCSEILEQPKEGNRIKIYLPLDATFYQSSVNEVNGNMFKIKYDGDVKEIIDLEKESWRYESAMNAGSIQISPP